MTGRGNEVRTIVHEVEEKRKVKGSGIKWEGVVRVILERDLRRGNERTE